MRTHKKETNIHFPMPIKSQQMLVFGFRTKKERDLISLRDFVVSRIEELCRNSEIAAKRVSEYGAEMINDSDNVITCSYSSINLNINTHDTIFAPHERGEDPKPLGTLNRSPRCRDLSSFEHNLSRNCLSKSHSEQNSKSAKPMTFMITIIGLSRVVSLLLAILCLKKWELVIESHILRNRKRNPNWR